ncbi:MAG: putative holin-like toxin [Bacillota bacterium]
MQGVVAISFPNGRGWSLIMNTYEVLSLMIMFGLFVIAILKFRIKK